jgi:hypothetical protein
MEQLGDGTSDAARRTCDESNFVFNFIHHDIHPDIPLLIQLVLRISFSNHVVSRPTSDSVWSSTLLHAMTSRAPDGERRSAVGSARGAARDNRGVEGPVTLS